MKKRKGAVWSCLAVMLVITLLVPAGKSVFYETHVCAESEEAADGVYTIQGKLWHATLDQPSMGNSALTQPMKIIKKGSQTTLQLEFHSLTSGVFTGYLYRFSYFPDWKDTENVPDGKNAQSVTVTSYYDGVYDVYNDPDTGLDSRVKGKYYPHFATMPIAWKQTSAWVQVYVPVMETISAGGGTQYARLLLDWNTLQKTQESVDQVSTAAATTSQPAARGTTQSAAKEKKTQTSAASEEVAKDKTKTRKAKTQKTRKPVSKKAKKKTEKKLSIATLTDGTYTISGQMLKIDKKTKSMSNEAIDHAIVLTVKKKKYNLTMNFAGLQVGTAYGYLSKLKYFTDGYRTGAGGVPSGTVKAVTVTAFQKDSSGKKVSDTYGTDYPKTVTFPMISQAKKDGYVPLQVFVPIMEAISAGTGTQPVYLKLDLNMITKGKKKTRQTAEKTASQTKQADKSKNPGSTDFVNQKENAATNTLPAVNAAKDATQNGTIYSCNVVPCYKHPVTGAIEDAGGASSYATGQGMVQSALSTKGMLEMTADGSNYLTLRMSLMDYTSNQQFWVQKRGQSGWQSASAAVTKRGSDSNGKTADICIAVPDKDSIVKISMYVQPMGRSVVFYAYAKDLKEGRPEDMVAARVSQTAGKTESALTTESTIEAQSTTEAAFASTQSAATTQDVAGIADAQGLRLSTALQTEQAEKTKKKKKTTNGTATDMSPGKWILVLTVSITVSGLLLLAAAAGIVYYFRRNWRRWGEEMEDDDE